MQATFLINHGAGPCFFLKPGPMRAARQDLEAHLRGFADTLVEPPRAMRHRPAENAPSSRDAQPHEDHPLPLMLAAGGASGEPDTVHFHGHALGKPISGFRFG